MIGAFVGDGRCRIVLCALLLGQLLFMLWLGPCVQEDAFISFRYARNWLDGNGLVYNPGERVEGYTNFLWTIIVAGGMAMECDPVAFARFLGIALALLLVLTTSAWARAQDRRRGVTAGLLAAVIVAASPGLASEAVQGLESVFFALLVTCGVWLGSEAMLCVGSAGRRSAGRSAAAGAILAVAAMTRPEGVGIFGLVLAGGVAFRIRRGEAAWSRADSAALLTFAVLYLPYWLWRFDYYGYPFPNTFYAKTGGGWQHALRGIAYVGRFLLLNPILALLSLSALVGTVKSGRADAEPAVGPGAIAGRNAGTGPLAIVALVVVGYLCYVIAVGGDFKRTFRFIIPILPLWGVLLDAAFSRGGWPGRRRAPADRRDVISKPEPVQLGPLRRGVWLVLGLMLANALVALPSTVRWARQRSWDLTRRTACGMYLAEHAEPDAVLAIHSAGIIPYYAGLRTIDMWGINDLHIGHRKMPDMGRERPTGHEKHDDAYVFAQEPAYFIDEWNYVLGEPVPDLDRHLFAAAEFESLQEIYDVRSVPLLLDDGRGEREYWFNYLERTTDEDSTTRPPADQRP